MDTQAVGFDQQVEELQKEIAAVNAKRAEVQQKLDLEKNALYTAEASRKGYVSLLAGPNDDSLAGYLEHEIDCAETKIVSHKRLIEGYEIALKGFDNQIQNLNGSLGRAMEMSEEERRASEFKCWESEAYRRYREASDALDAAREALGELIVHAGRGHEIFGGQADALLTGLNEQFFRTQGNLDGRGFRDRYDYNPAQFTFLVKPQIRRKDSLPPR
jgi:chromosome segregation ATPase